MIIISLTDFMKRNFFVKTDGLSQACLSFAMARKGAMKRNIIFRQSYIKTLISEVEKGMRNGGMMKR